ncbi:MAG: undecaprenyl-diphosphate phosphatase [Oligoflexus sp.]
MLTWWDVLFLSVLEGITEFLPVSSTGHMIVAADLMGMDVSPALDSFMVIIQVGAILGVITAYRETFMNWLKSWMKIVRPGIDQDQPAYHRRYSLLIAFAVIPFGLIGFLNRDFIKSLFNPGTVAIALIVGGVIILLESLLTKKEVLQKERVKEDFHMKDAFLIGFGQCLSLWPGFSRAAATLLAARFTGYSRPAAAELSFLIGLPTILGTGAYEMTSIEWNAQMLPQIFIGCLLSWLIAFFSVKWLVAFLQKYSLNVFGWYRIAMGALILLLV